MKKLLVFLALVTTCLLAKADASGTCGTNLTWVYTTADNTLTISGTGDMSNYMNTTVPWKSYNSSIKNVIIDDGVTSIGDYAFASCTGLTSVTIPDAVTSIGNYAFSGCSGLTSVIIPDAVTSIGSSAFSRCSGLKNVTIGNSVVSIGKNAFEYCSNIIEVQWNAERCSNFAPTINNPNTYNPTYDFSSLPFYSAKGKIKSFEFGDKVERIPNYLCYEVLNLVSLTIPDAVTSIGNYAFSGCSGLTSLTMGNAVTSIGESAFKGCSGFKTLTIPDQVEKIGRYAFKDCSDLYEIEFKGLIPPTTTVASGRYDFRSEDIPSSALIIVPCGTSALYGAKFHENETYPDDNSGGYFGGYSLIENCGTIHNTSYTIEPSDVNAGTVSGASGATVGETVTLTATPKEGYRFVRWSDGSIENPRTVTITDGMNLKAEFEILVFTINVVPNNVSYGSASGSGEYEYGSTAFIMASANNGYKFVKWNDGNTAVIRTIKVKKDSAFVAEFAEDESAVTPPTSTGSYTIGAADTNEGSVSVDGDAGIGKTVTITAEPKEGHRFKQWSDGNTENPRTVTITGGMNLKAEFEILVFTINVVPNNVSYGSASGSGEYEYGSTAFIMASANNGYKFVKWNDGNTAVIRTIKVKKDSAFVAEFAKDESAVTPSTPTGSYTIGAADPDGGSVSVDGEAGIGKTVTLTATPKDGYKFKQWSDGNTENPRTVTITDGMNLKAEYELEVYTIQVSSNNSNYGNAAGNGDYEYGSTAFIMASANNGYKFVKWNDGNTAVIRTIKVKKDSAFVAEFAEDESAVTPSTPTGSYTIGAADPDGGSVSVDGEAGIGKTVTLTATPKDGYKFKQWSDGNTENPRTVTITDGMNLKAEFEAYERTWKLNALEWNEDSTKVTVYFYCPEDGKTKSVEAKPVVVEQAATCHEKGSKKRVVTVAFEGQIYEESEETVVDAPRQNIVKKMWGDVLTVVDPNKEFIQYEWYRNGEFVSNKAYVSEAGGLTGEYTLQVTKRDGSKVCSNTVTMSEKRSSAALRVYPNPATDNVTIEGDFEEGSEIRIVDMNGVLVKKTKAATDGRATVMTSGMTAGAYTVIAGNDTARLIKK